MSRHRVLNVGVGTALRLLFA